MNTDRLKFSENMQEQRHSFSAIDWVMSIVAKVMQADMRIQ
jgi:hypothetical protein